MKIVRRTVGTVEVCAPQEALVDEGAAEFNELLRTYLGGANPRVVLAMNEVGYMDSTALEGLVSVADGLSESGNQLKLASVTPTCREILSLVGVSDRFQYFEGVDAAVRSFL